MYVKVIEEIEKISQLIHFALVKLTIPGVIIPSIFITTINYFVYHLGNGSYFLPFRMMYVLKIVLPNCLIRQVAHIFFCLSKSSLRLPYNWETPLNYLMTLLMLCVVVHFMAYSAIPLICFLIESCFLMKTFVEDISKDIPLLNEDVAHSSNKKSTKKTQIAKHFSNMLQNHSIVKQLSKIDFYAVMLYFYCHCTIHFRFAMNFNDCYEFIIIDISIWAHSSICCTLLSIHFELVEYKHDLSL